MAKPRPLSSYVCRQELKYPRNTGQWWGPISSSQTPRKLGWLHEKNVVPCISVVAQRPNSRQSARMLLCLGPVILLGLYYILVWLNPDQPYSNLYINLVKVFIKRWSWNIPPSPARLLSYTLYLMTIWSLLCCRYMTARKEVKRKSSAMVCIVLFNGGAESFVPPYARLWGTYNGSIQMASPFLCK